MPPARLLSALPRFLVPDVRAAAEHYRDALGFRICMLLGDAPSTFSIVDLAEGEGLHLRYDCGKRGRKNRAPAAGLPAERTELDAYVRVDDAERWHAELVRRGARILYPPIERPWRMKEFEVEDRDGFVMCFASDVDGHAPPGGVRGPHGILKIAPELLVRDVVRSVAFYREKLGFLEHGLFGDPPHYAIVGRDRMLLHLARAADGRQIHTNHAADGAWDVFVETAGIEALAQELKSRGVALLRGIDTTEYEMREIEVADPDGYSLCFGEPVAGWDVER